MQYGAAMMRRPLLPLTALTLMLGLVVGCAGYMTRRGHVLSCKMTLSRRTSTTWIDSSRDRAMPEGTAN